MNNVVTLNTNRNSNVNVFDFDENPVRVINKEGSPWFVGKDVCRALDLANHNDALSSLDDDEKGVANTDPLSKHKVGGGAQQAVIISEAGVYNLIFRSRKPEAKRFKRWVTHDVLPAIRKDGAYVMGEERAKDREDILINGLAAVSRKLERLADEMGEILPKAQAWEEFVNSEGLYCLQNVGRALSYRPKLAIWWMVEKFLHRQGGVLVPYQQYIKRGLFEVKSVTYSDGKRSKLQTFVTPKGLEYLSERLPQDLKAVAA